MKKYCEHSGIEIPSDESHEISAMNASSISTDELKAHLISVKSDLTRSVAVFGGLDAISIMQEAHTF